jgi:hypothetical protein
MDAKDDGRIPWTYREIALGGATGCICKNVRNGTRRAHTARPHYSHRFSTDAGDLSPGIALRNAVCERLQAVFANSDWLTSSPRPFAWRDSEGKKLVDAARQAQQASYTKLTESEKKRLDGTAFPNGVSRNTGYMRRSQARQRTLDVTHGQLVSQLTLFLWKRLFSADYEDALWKRGLKALFPDRTVGRSAVARRLEIIYKARNRIAHHEPIYGPRLEEVIAAIEFLVVRLENRACDEGSALAKLTFLHRVNLKAVANETSVSFSPVVVDPDHVTGAVEA